MKLDRNINPDGRGKYALVRMRRLQEIKEAGSKPHPHETKEFQLMERVERAFAVLLNAGVIQLGNETPGDQFFVMKYKDRFTAPALHAYAIAVSATVRQLEGQPPAAELAEYAQEMFSQARLAETTGNRIPD